MWNRVKVLINPIAEMKWWNAKDMNGDFLFWIDRTVAINMVEHLMKMTFI